MLDEANDQRRVLCAIANRAFGLVREWLDRDRRLAEQLRTEKARSRQIVREECITTDLAMTLREEFPSNVELTLFTPHEEHHITGADWYWRIERARAAIHALVQAKRVQRAEFGQPDVEGHIRLEEEQLETLVTRVKKASARLPGVQAWLARYASFEATPPCATSPRDCRSHGPECESCQYQPPSLWVALASNLQDRSGDVPVRDIVGQSLRLDCLLPCLDDSQNSHPSQKGFTLVPGLPDHAECISIIRAGSSLRSKIAGALRITV